MGGHDTMGFMTQNTGEHHQSGSIRTRGVLAALLVLGFGWVALAMPCEAKTTARVLPSGEEIEIASRGEEGLYTTTIPIYRSADIRYFSAGVGLEERDAEYPPFPLKLIFVEGEKAFTSHVEVAITDKAGTVRVNIPAEHVKGPWLFVDLPAGAYDITATKNGQTQTKASVAVRQGMVRIIHLRWSH